ncbi:MAG: hypothetical protein ACHRXM_35415 [Isosphaerales bacterium]
MSFVEDQERAGPEVAKPVAQGACVGFVDEQAVRDEEARVCSPWIDTVAPLLPDPGDVVLVEDLEDHSEAVFQLILPLQEHGRWAGHDDVLNLLAEQEFAGDQTGLDRLPEANIIGNEQVHPGQAQGFLQRLQLVGVDPDAGPERGLEEVRVGRGHAVPLEGVQVSREQLWRVEPLARDLLPGFGRDRLGVDLLLPEYFEGLALGVIVEAGHTHEGRVIPDGGRDDLFDKVLALPDADDIPCLGSPRHRLRFLDRFHRVAHDYPSTKDKRLA